MEMTTDHHDDSDSSGEQSSCHDHEHRHRKDQEKGTQPDAKRQRLIVAATSNGTTVKNDMDQVHREDASKAFGFSSQSTSAAATTHLCGPPTSHHPNNPTISDQSSVSNNTALFDALRASKATRGQHQQSITMFSSVVDQLKTNPYDGEGTRAARRLTGIQGTAAIMSQSAPIALSSVTSLDSSSGNTSTIMSAHHILRRLGNPHRRVVHQMLLQQHERILLQMKLKASESMSTSSSCMK
jgi:hypothetical protein